ncbi:MAG: serine/threonine protein kinase [Myxococcales bacterium]|nr:serine/threonine protein kinase [Myxococcales bacterium]
MPQGSSHDAQAESLLQALRQTLLTQDVGGIDALIVALGQASPQIAAQTARILADHGLSERAARLYEQRGQLSQALSLFQQAGELLEAGRVSEQLGHDAQAESFYRKVDPLQPSHPGNRSAVHRLGLLLLRQGRTDEAVPMLQAARRALRTERQPATELLDELELQLAHGLVQLGLPDAAQPLHDSYRQRHPSAPLLLSDWLRLTPARRSDERLLLGRYRLGQLLGAGGMGRVFRADDVVTGQTVAIKLLPQSSQHGHSSQAWQRFCAEAKILKALRHPNIVTLLDFSDAAGLLVMEYMRGGSLGELPLPLSLPKLARILIDVTTGLEVAHGAAVLHRDIKPHNLFLDEAHRTKIGDFGAALLGQLGATQTESIVGTLAYISPEQLDGQPLSFATDLYSLGVTMFQLLTGSLPFVGPDWVSQHLYQPAPDPRSLRPDVPPPWSMLCQQLLSKSAAERPASLEALLVQLRQLPTEDRAEPVTLQLGQRPSADAQLEPITERTKDDPSTQLHPSQTQSPAAVVARTPHSEIVHSVDLRLGRSLWIERFAPGSFDTEPGQAQRRWLQKMAQLGGPGLQRVLRIVETSAQPEVHYEEPIGHKPTEQAPLSVAHESLLHKTLSAIHRSGICHGTVSSSVLVEKHGPLLIVAGQGPLVAPHAAACSDPTADDDFTQLASLGQRRKRT